MANPFNTPLPSWARSSEYGFPAETFDFPSDMETDTSVTPELQGVGGGVSAYRANVGDVFQDTNPEYAGDYEPGFEDSPGAVFTNESTAPAVGSTDLAAPRASGGVAGNNRLIKSDGPVGNDGADHGRWTGNREEAHKPNVQYNGPVSGGPDYANSLGAAYFAAQQAAYSDQAANAAMVSAV